MKKFIFTLLMLICTLSLYAQNEKVSFKIDKRTVYYKVINEGADNKYYRQSKIRNKVSKDFMHPSNEINQEMYDSVNADEYEFSKFSIYDIDTKFFNGYDMNIISNFTNSKEKYTYLSGLKLQKSAVYQASAIGSALVSGVFFFSAPNTNHETKKNMYYVLGGLFGVGSIFCEVVSINQKLKAGKYLKIAACSSGVGVAYNF